RSSLQAPSPPQSTLFPYTTLFRSRMGVRTGDRVVIYMPMIPEAVIAMLACARIGAVHSVVFGGFAAHELAARIDDAEPVLIITRSEEHTSELQSPYDLVCRLLLEK